MVKPVWEAAESPKLPIVSLSAGKGPRPGAPAPGPRTSCTLHKFTYLFFLLWFHDQGETFEVEAGTEAPRTYCVPGEVGRPVAVRRRADLHFHVRGGEVTSPPGSVARASAEVQTPPPCFRTNLGHKASRCGSDLHNKGAFGECIPFFFLSWELWAVGKRYSRRARRPGALSSRPVG